MADRKLYDESAEAMTGNPQQIQAIGETRHCVVLAGPGSGKTRTLTTAMARSLLEDVAEPRGIACITYNNECAVELEDRLQSLGIESDDRVFIGTVHSFALSQIVIPYARCVYPGFPEDISVASKSQQDTARDTACDMVITDGSNQRDAWFNAVTKRKAIIDRNDPSWVNASPRLTRLIETYEAELRKNSLIDYEDMTLIAARMIIEHDWIRKALRAKFPVLFVDEYQDLGSALHNLVLQLCFVGGIQLFAVGDPDQSIYRFAGADPRLLESLSSREDVVTIQLPFNYRCGTSIIEASNAALGEERGYQAPEGAHKGEIIFNPVDGGEDLQANFVFNTLVPSIIEKGVRLEDIAVLYKDANVGNLLSGVADSLGFSYIRADKNALVVRASRISRLTESCAKWTMGGWQESDPQFRRLAYEAQTLVYGKATGVERREIERELAIFLHKNTMTELSTHEWLLLFKKDLVNPWLTKARTQTDDWAVLEQMIVKTDPETGQDISMLHFSGRFEETGRINLSTLHSAKGREFPTVILFGMNRRTFPDPRDANKPEAIREARRLFYVGVTRAKNNLHLVFQRKLFTPWVLELHRRITPKKS